MAAKPTLGDFGYWMMGITALFATAGATNAGLYPAPGLCEHLASIGQFPPLLSRRLGGRVPAGLLVTALIAAVLAVGFDLNAIASIGSVVALQLGFVPSAFADAANPSPTTTGVATVNADGTVTAKLSGTWSWPGQTCCTPVTARRS